MHTYARTGIDTWALVAAFDRDFCTIFPRNFSFEEVWTGAPQMPSLESVPPVSKSWSELLCPIPHPDIPCWAYAFSYSSHQREMRRNEMFRFKKLGPVQVLLPAIAYRDHLDYEAEIGVLLHRAAPARFGYLMLNDLTDRGIQVLSHSRDRLKQIDSFSKAKSFAGALAIGPLIAIGSAEDWSHLEISLSLNGVIRQTVRALDCGLTPPAVHRELFGQIQDHEWLLAATGTSEGVMLNVPSPSEKLRLLFQGRLSLKKARQLHLHKQTFLRPGDELEMLSSVLGYARSIITKDAPNVIKP